MAPAEQHRAAIRYWGKIAVFIYAVVVIPAWVTGYAHSGPGFAQNLILLINAIGAIAAVYAIIEVARYYQ